MLLGDPRTKNTDYVIETWEINGKPKERSVYIGTVLAYDSPRLGLRLKIFLIVVGAYFLAAFFGCGFSAFNNNLLYVLIPYILEIVPLGLYVLSVVNLVSYGVLVKECDMGKTIGRIFPVCIIFGILCLLAGVGDVIFAGLNFDTVNVINETAFICCSFLGVYSAATGAAASKKFAFHEVENPDKKRITLEKQRQNELDALAEIERREALRRKSREINNKKNKK